MKMTPPTLSLAAAPAARAEPRHTSAAANTAPSLRPVAKASEPHAVDELADRANHELAASGHSVRVSRNEATGHYVVRVLDGAHELVRQFPSEEFLAMSERLESLRGVLFEGQG